MADKKCPHPPHRLFCSTVDDPFTGTQIWAACCDCGELLRSGYSEKTFKTYAAQQEQAKQDGLFEVTP